MQKFVLDFGSHIENCLSDEQLSFVLKELDVFMLNYDVSMKETGLSTYIEQLPEEFKMFIIAKKVAGRSNDTLKLYNYHIVPFLYQIGKKISEITDMDIVVYLYTLQKNRPNLGNHSLEHIRLILSSFFGWCHDNGYIKTNPIKAIQPIKYEKKEISPIGDEEFERTRLSFTDPRDKAIFETLYSTGCRVGELVNIKTSDIDLKAREVHLFGKGQKHRTSFLNARSIIAIRDYMDIRPKQTTHNNLFVSKRYPYNPIKVRSVQSILRKHRIAMSEDRLHPHLLRHQFANTWVDKGLSVEELQQILGHEKISTTQLYFKSSKERAKANHQRYIA